MSPKQEVLVSCNRCTVKVPIGQTIYEKDGQNLICFECYNKIAKGLEPEVYKTMQSADIPAMIGYKCNNCNFRFSRLDTFQFGGHCFNCGKANVVIEDKVVIPFKDRKSLLDY